MTVLTVSLNPALDAFVRVKKSKVQEISVSAGGKGVNVARGLRFFKVHCLAVGFAGGANGRFLKKELKQEKIPYQFVEVHEETRCNVTILNASKEETRILGHGAKIDAADWKLFKRKFSSWLKKCDCVILSGKAPVGLTASVYAELIYLAHRHRVKAILDTSGMPLKRGFAANPFLIKPNRQEAAWLLLAFSKDPLRKASIRPFFSGKGKEKAVLTTSLEAERSIKKKLNSIPKIKEAVQYLVKQGIETVIVSLGSQGAVGIRDNETIWAKPPALKPRSSVGCGDTLLAAFVAADLRGKSFKESLRRAVAAGSANTQEILPGMLQARTFKRILKQTSVRQI